jgi:hypothetical protein
MLETESAELPGLRLNFKAGIPSIRSRNNAAAVPQQQEM